MSDLTNPYYTKYNKSHDKHGIDFDTVVPSYTFAPINIAQSQTSGTVQQVLSIPQDTKFMKVSVSCAAISGAATAQVVVGGAAVGSAGSANTVAVSGTPLTAAINVPAANTQTTVACTVPDAVVSGLPLTLRAVTAAGNTVTGLQVSLVGVPVDPSPATDAQQSPYNNADPSNW